MTIKEIKDNLGIDISIKNRSVVNVVFKALYVEYKLNDLKEMHTPDILKLISNDINCSRTNVYNYLKKLKGYKLGIGTKLIVKAFYEKDKKYLDEYNNHIKQIHESKRDSWVAQKAINEIEIKPKIIKLQKTKPIKLKSNLQVADYLKANKIFKYSHYWDTLINDYTDEDWFKLRKINPTMFDTYIK